jgi:outer membrane usher protein
MRREVPTGPFSIQDLPVVTGRGDMRLVVRDALGREHVIVQPFYASAQLLQAGLHDYSYELGLVRERYAIASNEYGRAAASATHRVGFSDHLTGEIRAEILREQQTAGVGAAWLVPVLGLFNASLAASHGPEGKGGLVGVGFERQSARWGVGASTQVASPGFVQMGMLRGEPAARQLSRAYVSFSSPFGSFATTYAHHDFRGRDGAELVSASYSVSLGAVGFVSLSMLRFLGGDARTTFGVTYTLPLDSATSASVGATLEQGRRQGQVQLQRNLPAGPGWGYRVLAAGGDPGRGEAGVSAQTDFGTYVLEAARSEGETGYRASASGGFALIGGRPFLARRVDSSFAVVDLPGYPGVRIYESNQFVARTDGSGVALVPRLLPYQRNVVRIEQADLPMDAEIDAYQMDAVPWFRSGMLLQFPIRRSRGATLTLLQEDGAPMPSGALVRVGDQAEEFPVGQRGEVYVTGLDASNRVRASWAGRACEVVVAFPPTLDPLPDLGTRTCRNAR